jgi:hypothetical protein
LSIEKKQFLQKISKKRDFHHIKKCSQKFQQQKVPFRPKNFRLSPFRHVFSNTQKKSKPKGLELNSYKVPHMRKARSERARIL